MMVLAKIKLSLELTNQERICKLSEALKAADHGLLLGGELRNELTKTAEILTLQLSKCNSKKIFDNILEPSSSLPEFCGIRGDLIPVLSCPSLETFYSDYFKPRKPVVLKDCINHWPALSKWKDINYLLTKAGERTVPVELGSKYDDSEWSQKLMNFRQFVEQHILVTKNKNETGYLAQHQLFLQIPELKEDIREPEFCCCSDLKETNLNEENEDVDINAWFGPAGTVSPLHFDPKHNLLTQIVGRKRIILYDPKYSDRLRPYETKLLNNTAQVDPESPDYNKFSGYKDTPALETILNPGEMLYIPPTWWHHVRSLDISFSVSFWW
ncbi:lysine-specific demethylase 8-like isoform X2 [Lycorma delicatula]